MSAENGTIRRVAEERSVEEALEASVHEGVQRLHRSWSTLLATGALGGIDVGFGVLALLVVQERTGDPLLGSLAFTSGFVILMMARSELFTENFLVPVTAVVTRNATVRQVLRLWAGTAAANLAGGWIFMSIVVVAEPRLGRVATEVAGHFVGREIGWGTFASAVLAGAMMTLMTWMERGSPAFVGKLVAAVIAGFVLSAAPLLHSIVTSLEHFAALWSGAPWGVGTWLKLFGVAVVGNVLGGMLLVTGLRLVQVDRRKLAEQRSGEATPGS